MAWAFQWGWSELLIWDDPPFVRIPYSKERRHPEVFPPKVRWQAAKLDPSSCQDSAIPTSLTMPLTWWSEGAGAFVVDIRCVRQLVDIACLKRNFDSRKTERHFDANVEEVKQYVVERVFMLWTEHIICWICLQFGYYQVFISSGFLKVDFSNLWDKQSTVKWHRGWSGDPLAPGLVGLDSWPIRISIYQDPLRSMDGMDGTLVFFLPDFVETFFCIEEGCEDLYDMIQFKHV